MFSSDGFAVFSAITAALQVMAERDRRYKEAKERNRELYDLMTPGGYSCHAWPLSVRPFILTRYQTDSRQQRRYWERKGSK